MDMPIEFKKLKMISYEESYRRGWYPHSEKLEDNGIEQSIVLDWLKDGMKTKLLVEIEQEADTKEFLARVSIIKEKKRAKKYFVI